MLYLFRFAYPMILIGLIVLIAVALLYRYYYYTYPYYRFSLSDTIAKHIKYQHFNSRKVLYALRFVSILLLAFLIARPQLIDSNAHVNVEGIDIMLVLDVSGSMQCFDDLKDRRNRLEVAKQEAQRFIKKRDHDPVGLVIFGRDAVSRCPLTLDKSLLRDIINDLLIGVVDPNGTVMSTGLTLAIKRLKKSQAKSKVIILLTDGEPTPHLDLKPDIPVTLANKNNIKIYTIAIGGDHGGLVQDKFFGFRSMNFRVNKRLLSKIAKDTGGQFFEAKKPQDLKTIYTIIDDLEKTEYETNIFTKYYDIFFPFLLIVIGLCGIELFLSSFVWFSL